MLPIGHCLQLSDKAMCSVTLAALVIIVQDLRHISGWYFNYMGILEADPNKNGS